MFTTIHGYIKIVFEVLEEHGRDQVSSAHLFLATSPLSLCKDSISPPLSCSQLTSATWLFISLFLTCFCDFWHGVRNNVTSSSLPSVHYDTWHHFDVLFSCLQMSPRLVPSNTSSVFFQNFGGWSLHIALYFPASAASSVGWSHCLPKGGILHLLPAVGWAWSVFVMVRMAGLENEAQGIPCENQFSLKPGANFSWECQWVLVLEIWRSLEACPSFSGAMWKQCCLSP